MEKEIVSVSKADNFYIQQHHDKMSDRAIAKDLGISVKIVREVIKKLKGKEPKVPAPDVSKEVQKPTDLFYRKHGAVVMTAGQSQADDERAGNSPFVDKPTISKDAKADEYVKRNQDSIFKIDPNKPVK